MFEDMMISGEGLNDPSITKIVCEEALDAYEWLKNVLGVHYQTRVEVFGGHRVPRCYSPDSLSGSTMIQKMKQKCVELGILIYCGVCVESIIIDEHYRVCGVNADTNFSLDPAHPKKSVHYWASKGIIVYSGGLFRKTIEPWMKPLVTLPNYSMRITPKTHYSLGGLKTDTQTHVLDTQGKIISGLFAAGEVTGLTHGANRLDTCSITECLVMGRIAGKQVLYTSL